MAQWKYATEVREYYETDKVVQHDIISCYEQFNYI